MSTSKISAKSLLIVAPLAAITAAAINAILYFIGKALGAMNDSVLVQPRNVPITVGPVIFASIIPTLIAAGVFALLNRFTANPIRIFTILSGILLVLSYLSPFMSIPNIPIGMGIWLNLMHTVVAGVVVVAFSRFTASK